MTRFVMWLLRLFGFQHPEVPSRLPGATFAPDWEDEHRRTWALFLKTPTGQVMWQRMLAVSNDVAQRSAQDVMHTAHSAGRAAGFNDALTWLHSLSRVSRDSDTTAMEAPLGEDALHERLSP